MSKAVSWRLKRYDSNSSLAIRSLTIVTGTRQSTIIIFQIQAWVRSEDNKFTPPSDFNFTHWDEGEGEEGHLRADEDDDSNVSPVWQALRPGPPLARNGISPSAIRFMRGIMGGGGVFLLFHSTFSACGFLD